MERYNTLRYTKKFEEFILEHALVYGKKVKLVLYTFERGSVEPEPVSTVFVAYDDDLNIYTIEHRGNIVEVADNIFDIPNALFDFMETQRAYDNIFILYGVEFADQKVSFLRPDEPDPEI